LFGSGAPPLCASGPKTGHYVIGAAHSRIPQSRCAALRAGLRRVVRGLSPAAR
jgi:hypothetical protein